MRLTLNCRVRLCHVISVMSRQYLMHRRALPWLPCTSIFMNIFLIGNLPYKSFIRFGVLIGVGLVLYFLYGAPSTRTTQAMPAVTWNRIPAHESSGEQHAECNAVLCAGLHGSYDRFLCDPRLML